MRHSYQHIPVSLNISMWITYETYAFKPLCHLMTNKTAFLALNFFPFCKKDVENVMERELIKVKV